MATAAIRFDEAVGFHFILANAPLPERIAAAREMLLRLDAEDGIDATAGFEFSRVSVHVKTASTDWVADFHVVWPEPQLNNQHLSGFRLVNWCIAGDASQTRAPGARKKALESLKVAAAAILAAGQPLSGKVSMVLPAEG